MIEPKLEVPAELRELAEKTIDQAEKAFGMFFDAAGKSMESVPSPGTEMSRQALSFTEQNMKAAFELLFTSLLLPWGASTVILGQ